MPNDLVIALILARSGSKSVPDKNIRPLAGHPVLAWSIAAARLCPSIDRVVVSTDSPHYAEIARAYGAEVPFLRPEALAADNSPDRDAFLHALAWLLDNEGEAPEYWVHLRPTTPLRDPQVMHLALETIRSTPDATSLRSAHPAPESPCKWFRRSEQGLFQGLLDGLDPEEASSRPRQSYDRAYIPDGYMDVLRRSHFGSAPTLYGKHMLGFVSPPCTEIDTLEELNYIEYQAKLHGSPLLDWLGANTPEA
ncbi:MAG: acylneuraminate cytidylyltransferase family protein [Desulfovibrionaceae bacterium]